MHSRLFLFDSIRIHISQSFGCSGFGHFASSSPLYSLRLSTLQKQRWLLWQGPYLLRTCSFVLSRHLSFPKMSHNLSHECHTNSRMSRNVYYPRVTRLAGYGRASLTLSLAESILETCSVVLTFESAHTKFLVCLRYVKGMVVHTLNIPRTYLEHTMNIPTLGI